MKIIASNSYFGRNMHKNAFFYFVFFFIEKLQKSPSAGSSALRPLFLL